MAGEIHDWARKIDQIANDLKSQGICQDEAKALEKAYRDVTRAEDDLEDAFNGRAWNGLISVGGGIALVSCPSIETVVTGPACALGGLLAGVGGLASWLLGDSQVEHARDKLGDALDDMSDALDAVCKCKMQHGATNP